ncbi:MAG: hypothetical protein A4E35_01936 [Methanoregula sp. PtaU1.Bin051]|nr:MAG: hypothetical protein A4E35_01936 [Methanoregula sp. PtaU1.Bin051]
MVDNKVIFLKSQMEKFYLKDNRPWIVGLSGGKDSTCITQLVYEMLLGLPPEKRKKKVFVLSSDTLVESPIADKRRKEICFNIEKQARIDNIPLFVKILRPELGDTFWVNLIGRGYPSPNRWFRWCTDRLKISPMNKFTLEQVKENGEVIIVLGIRKSESQNRQRTIESYEIKDTNLSKHSEIPGALIYAPLGDWKEKEVWNFLLSTPSPWGDDNRELLKYYSKGEDEIEFIIDNKGKAGGSSRMGCWVCTVVPRDWSLEGFINDGESWLLPLLNFRNKLQKIREDPSFREDTLKVEKKKKIIAEILGKQFNGIERYGHKMLGPFTLKTRHELLLDLIELQNNFELKKRQISLISPEEIQAIITLWIYEGDNLYEIVDVLRKAGASEFFVNHLLNQSKNEVIEIQNSICKKYQITPELINKLLVIENDLSGLSRRHGIYNRLDTVIENYVLNEMKKDAEATRENT